MHRRNSEFESRSTRARVPAWIALAVGLMMLMGGCATPARTASEPGPKKSDAAVVAPIADKPLRPALVEVEEDVGFTVTEVVAITGERRADYREAVSLLAQDDFERGIALLEALTDKVPDATAPHIDLGIAYSRTGEFEKAESSFNRALTSTPDHPIAHNELGIVYRKQGRFADARQSYERALAIYPGFHYARRNLAVLCDLYLADLSCALEHYEIYRQSVAEDREVDIWMSDIRNRVGEE